MNVRKILISNLLTKQNLFKLSSLPSQLDPLPLWGPGFKVLRNFVIPACNTTFEWRHKHAILLGGLFPPPRPRATIRKCVFVRNKIVPGRMKRKREMARKEQRKNNYRRECKRRSCPPSQLEPLPLWGPGFKVLRKFPIPACRTAFESRHKHAILLGGLFSPPRPRATVPKCVFLRNKIVPGRMKRKREMARMEQRKNNYCRGERECKRRRLGGRVEAKKFRRLKIGRKR
ncbi:hypothetical protein CEXT_281871 [Caerostris extrusa]|uniref:Uncharacterized protein n=1 Tax=Caerostris extrusa TaxID=172846 RepID=A0AAV4TMG5_CAEEX|nr:hypothetical protein CEXT_281871 [Caerostris extrusa]